MQDAHSHKGVGNKADGQADKPRRVASDSEAELSRLRAALDASGDVVYDWNLEDDSIIWRGPAADLFGLTTLATVATGDGFNRRINPEDLASRLRALSNHYAARDPLDCEYRIRSAKGRLCWVHERGTAQFSGSGHPVRMVGTIRVVTSRKQQEAGLVYRAHFDELTGHFNQVRLREALDHAVLHGARYNAEGGYLSVAVDNLSAINEMYGRETGDAIILGVGQHLENCLRASDIIGRYGGDRFGIILGERPQGSLEAVADKILCYIKDHPLETPSGMLPVTVSIGGASFPSMADTAQDVMVKADLALQQAVEGGEGRFVAYTMSEGEQQNRRENAQIATRVNHALQQGDIIFAYQPVVSSGDQTVDSYECLLRMRRSDGSIVAAAEFIGACEETGLMRRLDRVSLEMAVRDLGSYPDIVLALNISGLTVADQSWLRCLIAYLRGARHIAERLVIEITETAALHDLEESARFVTTVRDLGCSIALDDFGAGYTSFRHLKALPVDMVKIDGTFIRNIARDFDDQLFVRTLLGLANGFGLKTVAECVEDAESAEMLKTFGVDYLQGHYFGRPATDRPWEKAAAGGKENKESGKDSAGGAFPLSGGAGRAGAVRPLAAPLAAHPRASS